ncbi:Transposon Ty3-I Gag-Pol polyprotein [Vitis vinifera]|uniref:Transposon Ty3-I Gag-Pol polyprotein n=1 Tax=Vitis vinifera TaxID=29760 RepID=A0A438CF83_VITVI|nr:Transposon Ty3-I Gag-Pol polyprotein [Vitis vinifera]
MDGMQNDLSQKIDNIQYSISRLTNLNTVNEKGKFPSQPSQNPKGVHEVETQDGESSNLREVKAVITLRSRKEVNQPLPKDLCTVKRGLNVTKKAFLTEQLTFGNMTLELNIFHLCKRHLHPEEEEGFEEEMGRDLPLFNKEDSQGAAMEDPSKLVLKPLPVDLKKCKKAIGWTISDLKGINPLVCTHHIYMEEDAKPMRQPQRRLNPHMQEVLVGEPNQVVPKKSGITVIQNEKGEEVSTRPTSGWRVCIDYRRLNSVTRKDHFPLPFMDQVLERVLGHPFYCFLDGYSGVLPNRDDLEDQEKTTFTCPFGTFAYRRMPFGLCNAPATFQRCMLSIFSDMVERIMEVFMDDITIYGDSYEECLLHLEAVLQKMY